MAKCFVFKKNPEGCSAIGFLMEDEDRRVSVRQDDEGF